MIETMKPTVWEPVKKVWQKGCSLEGWMYAVNDNSSLGLRTIGYCMSWEERKARTQADILQFGSFLAYCSYQKHKFHEAPHHTKMEAIECYRDYLFDLHTRLHWYKSEDYICDLCGSPSSFSAHIVGTSTQGSPVYLCNSCSTSDGIREAFYKVFWIGEVTNLGTVRPSIQRCLCSSSTLFNFGCQCEKSDPNKN